MSTLPIIKLTINEFTCPQLYSHLCQIPQRKRSAVLKKLAEDKLSLEFPIPHASSQLPGSELKVPIEDVAKSNEGRNMESLSALDMEELNSLVSI